MGRELTVAIGSYYYSAQDCYVKALEKNDKHSGGSWEKLVWEKLGDLSLANKASTNEFYGSTNFITITKERDSNKTSSSKKTSSSGSSPSGLVEGEKTKLSGRDCYQHALNID